MRTLPALVANLTHAHGAWIVGSAAHPENTDPRDYDLVVPHEHWHAAAMLLPKDAKLNTFGGLKCMSEGKEIDVWPGDLGWIMQRPMCNWVWHPLSGVRWQKT